MRARHSVNPANAAAKAERNRRAPVVVTNESSRRDTRGHMKTFLSVITASALALTLQTGTASAKGCIKGAIVGGVAGHYAGHHGFVGAAAGCAIGRHEANKKAREKRDQTNGAAPRTR